jgi:hypothetical protein
MDVVSPCLRQERGDGGDEFLGSLEIGIMPSRRKELELCP